jgi:hypothetical protein
MDHHFVIAEHKRDERYRYVVGYCIDRTRTLRLVLHKLREIGVENYLIASGDTMVEAIDDFNAHHRPDNKVNREESAWWHVARTSGDKPDNEKAVLLVGDFADGCIVKPPEPVTMPNGQVGYICLGRCHGFFSCTEANTLGGFICRECRK